MGRRKPAPWAPEPWEPALAAALGPDAAWIPTDAGIAFVRERAGPGAAPALALALAAWEAHPGQAHAVLRARIRIAGPPTALDRAVAQVAAKRVVEVAPGPAAELPPLVDLGWALELARARIASASGPCVDGAPVAAPPALPALRARVLALVPAPADLARRQRDRPVAALLLDADGRPRWVARNAGGANRVLHAELVLVRSWASAHGPIPAGWRLAASLQPCRMCAALIAAACAGPIEVLYAEPDPGPLARDTELQRLGWERPL